MARAKGRRSYPVNRDTFLAYVAQVRVEFVLVFHKLRTEKFIEHLGEDRIQLCVERAADKTDCAVVEADEECGRLRRCAPRMVCTSYGIVGADVRPNWQERA